MSLAPSKRRLFIPLVVAAAVALAAGLTPTSAMAAPGVCVAGQLITADCIDTQYATPVIDSETDQTSPVVHHRILGHFEGTNIQFSVYLPPANQWKGRFFQYTYPLTDANATDRAVGFGAENGGYTVQAGSSSGTSLGYRHAAAAAKLGRTLAAAYYGADAANIPGYLYGPSGGSFQTIGAAEGSAGVWQGFVPMVLGDPMATPYTFFIRAMARLVLEDDAAAISDAVSPGGSGNPYTTLDDAEATFLHELVSFGVPLKAWEDPDYLLGLSTSDGLLGFGAIIKQIDSTYADDFWSKPGYLGTEQSALGDLVRAALAAGGDRWSIALGTYHRHQLPPATAGYYGFDQFRNSDGTPRYPQRSLVIGPLILGSTSGNAAYSGKINGKVIVVDNLLDVDALPWRADWYSKRVQTSLGQQGFQNNFRIYLNERADHIEGEKAGAAASRLINYWGSVEQALRDVSAWHEQGKIAPASTRYTVSDAQISVPRIALQRRGIQPVIDLTANLRDEVVNVRRGQKVGFAAAVQLPTTTARVVSTEWDFDGDGIYEARSFKGTKLVVGAAASFAYQQPGTYFASIRVTTQEGNTESAFGRVQNIDRLRVVVQ